MIAASCVLMCIAILAFVEPETWVRWNASICEWAVKSTTITSMGEQRCDGVDRVVDCVVEVDYRFGAWPVLFAWLWLLRAVALVRGL